MPAGQSIAGIVLSGGDPFIRSSSNIKSMGGPVQTVPRNRIGPAKRLTRSLMFSADMLGLNSQPRADIAAYLQSAELK